MTFQISKSTIQTNHHIHIVRWLGGFDVPGGCGACGAMLLYRFFVVPRATVGIHFLLVDEQENDDLVVSLR